jgi:ribosomal protein S12 methylthiotransferase
MGFKPGKSRTNKCIIDRIEGGHFVGRTEFDSPDVDNKYLLILQNIVKTGDFAMIKKIIEATEFDLYGEPA